MPELWPHHLLRNVFRKTDTKSRSPLSVPMLACRRLRTEMMEDRRMLAAVTVDNDLDIVNGDTASIAALIANDGGDGIALREALAAANNTAGADSIDFDPLLSGKTIILGGTQLSIADDLTLTGLGASQLAINAGGTSRVMMVTGNAVADISGLTLSGGSADRGGGLRNYGGVATTLSSVVIQGNTATLAGGGSVHDAGGGIWNSGELTINDSLITGNTTSNANAYGGGIWNNDVLAITRTAISNNMATDGGAIYSTTDESDVTIIDSSVSGNTASDDAGGIFAYGTLLVVGSTVSGNVSSGAGGGVMVNTDSATIRHSTITGNSGERGGGIRDYSRTVVLDHTIVANNTATTGPDIDGTVTANFSLIEDTTDATISGGDNVLGLAPVLGPLQNNGGPTPTHALLPGSPAIDTGDPAAVAGAGDVPLYDQRGTGFPRVFDAAVDIGAIESFSDTFVVDTADDESDGDFSPGDLSLREAIELANISPTADTITFHATLAGSTISLAGTELAITDAVALIGLGADQITVDAQGASRVMMVDAGATVEISGLTLTGGTADRGGGFLNNVGSAATLRDVVIRDNSATTTNSDAGGGIWNAGELAIIDSRITGNATTSSNAYGGGICNRAVLSITRSTVSGNRARDGGGIYTAVSTSLAITDSTISANAATDQGGGIFSVINDPTGAAATTIVGSTISGNTANFGGGIYNFAGVILIQHSTITLNTATADGAGVGDRGTVSGRIVVQSSIIAANSDDDDVHVGSGVNSFVSFGHNIIGGGSASDAFVEPGDQVNIFDPMLSPLEDNGGPTFTHAPLPGSPAIDSGDPAAVAGVGDVPLYDQRGEAFDRVLGNRIDIGAVESDAGPLQGDGNLDGTVDGLDYLVWASFYSDDPARDPPGSPENGDYNNDGVVDGHDYLVWASNYGNNAPTTLAVAPLSDENTVAVDTAIEDDFDTGAIVVHDATVARWQLSRAFDAAFERVRGDRRVEKRASR